MSVRSLLLSTGGWLTLDESATVERATLTRARHRRASAIDWKSRIPAGIRMGAALAAGTLTASCLLTSSGPVAPAENSSAVGVSASRPTPSVRHAVNPASPPAANPAEGHSPQLEKELSGPLAGTGLALPSHALTTSAEAMRASASVT